MMGIRESEKNRFGRRLDRLMIRVGAEYSGEDAPDI